MLSAKDRSTRRTRYLPLKQDMQSLISVWQWTEHHMVGCSLRAMPNLHDCVRPKDPANTHVKLGLLYIQPLSKCAALSMTCPYTFLGTIDGYKSQDLYDTWEILRPASSGPYPWVHLAFENDGNRSRTGHFTDVHFMGVQYTETWHPCLRPLSALS